MSHATRFRKDFGLHIESALRMPDTLEHVSYPLFHAVLLLMHRLLGLEPQLSALVAILLLMAPVPVIAFALYKGSVGNHVPDGVLMLFALGLAIMSPIAIWTSKYMIGYLNPIVYHNPTSITLRLFVIPVSVLAFRCFQSQPYRSLNHRVYILSLCAVLQVLSVMAKPSFAVALVPGCILFAFWRILRRGHVDWTLLALGIVIPTTLMIALQSLITYVDFDDGSSIAIGFLTLMNLYTPIWRIPVQLLLSIVFPIGVGLLYAKQARQHLFLSFAWTVFICAILVTYMLYESGSRMPHGNFIWTGYSAVFLLMFASTIFLLQQYVRELRHNRGLLQVFGLRFSRRFAVASFLFSLQVIAGIAYCFRFLSHEFV